MTIDGQQREMEYILMNKVYTIKVLFFLLSEEILQHFSIPPWVLETAVKYYEVLIYVHACIPWQTIPKHSLLLQLY